MEESNPYQAPSAELQHDAELHEHDQSSPLSPKGRFGRLSYLAWYMIVSTASWVVQMLLGFLGLGMQALVADPSGSPEMSTGALVAVILVSLVSFYFYIVFAIRRLHDINGSGWWMLLFIVPIANLVLGLVLLFARGNEGPNRFAPPRVTPSWEKVLGYIAIVFFVVAIVGVLAAIGIPAYQSYIEAAQQAAAGS